MEGDKGECSKWMAFVLASTTIASYIVYRYYFSQPSITRPKESSKKGDDNLRKEGSLEGDPPKASRSSSDTASGPVVEVPSATVIKAPPDSSSSLPKSKSEERASDQSQKAVQLPKAPVKGKSPAVDEIDVEFSPSGKSPRVSTAEEISPSSKKPSPPVVKEEKVNAYYCGCGATTNASSVIEGELDENTKVAIMQTLINPVHFDQFVAVSLGGEQGTSDLSDASLSQISPSNHSQILPFLPTLHAITYAKKHSDLLNQLVENYQYYERNYVDV